MELRRTDPTDLTVWAAWLSRSRRRIVRFRSNLVRECSMGPRR